ncbi:PGG domain [Sesbania bispinosa]|nr:PGG domain [Sesbania bispinosa]
MQSKRLDLNSGNEQEKIVHKLEFSKETKESHLLVATLIATLSFAAAFTLPGGTIQEGEHKGSPILGHRASFKAFMVSNTIALVLSAFAAFIHLFPPQGKGKSYFLCEAAFSFTLVAVAAMIIAFATGMYAVLGSTLVGIVVITIGSWSVLVFGQVLGMSSVGAFFLSFARNLAQATPLPFVIPFGFYFRHWGNNKTRKNPCAAAGFLRFSIKPLSLLHQTSTVNLSPFLSQSVRSPPPFLSPVRPHPSSAPVSGSLLFRRSFSPPSVVCCAVATSVDVVRLCFRGCREDAMHRAGCGGGRSEQREQETRDCEAGRSNDGGGRSEQRGWTPLVAHDCRSNVAQCVKRPHGQRRRDARCDGNLLGESPTAPF